MNFERQHTRCMNNFFREVNLEMTDDFAARFAPAAHRGKTHVLEQFPTLVQDFVERFTAPILKCSSVHESYIPFSPTATAESWSMKPNWPSIRVLTLTATEILPSIHAKNLPGDTGCAWPAKKQNSRCNICRFQQTSQETLCERGVLHRLRYNLRQWRAYPSGLDYIDQDSEMADLSRDTFGEPDQSCFACGISGRSEFSTRAV